MSQQPRWDGKVQAFHQQSPSSPRWCQFCGTENRPAAQFCAKCGGRLTAVLQSQPSQFHPPEKKPVQMNMHQPQPKKFPISGKQIGALIGIIAAIIGITSGGIAIVKSLQNHLDTFEGNVAQQTTADNFVSFTNNHDGKVVWLNITCVSSTVMCFVPGETQETTLPIHATSGEYWFHIDTAGTDAQANNGQYGAGLLVVKGYFEVSVQGVLGAYPQEVQNTFLKGVDSSAVNKG